MDLMDWMVRILENANPRFVNAVEKTLKKFPFVNKRLQEEYQQVLQGAERSLKPYKEKYATYTYIPPVGLDKEAVLQEMQALHSEEESRWEDGYVSGAVYHGDQEHIEFLNQVYAIHSQSNPLHVDIWPSVSKYEAEIVAMRERLREHVLRIHDIEREAIDVLQAAMA